MPVKARDFFAHHLADYLADLRRLVEIETPTRHVDGLSRAAALLAELLAPHGGVERTDLAGFGPLLRLRRPGAGSRVLLLGHADTVWPVGSWAEPWRKTDGRIFGPGVYDMKGGLLFIPWLLRWLDETRQPSPELDILINPDEEVGSLGSQETVRAAAAAADIALVLEPTNAAGVLKLARKASGDFFVHITGRAAHQGAEPERGVNAIVEAAHQILRLIAFADPAAGTTVGPNLVAGGTAANTVADRAELAVDVRAWTLAETGRLEAAIRGLEPVLAGTSIRITGQWNRPPMEVSAAALELFDRAQRIGAGLGLELDRAAWGGSSDANFAAAAGAATIDGFGPVGQDAHQKGESIVVDALPARFALVAELVASLAEPLASWMSEASVTALRSRASRT